LSYDKQIDKQTDSKIILPTPTDIVGDGVGNKLKADVNVARGPVGASGWKQCGKQ